MLTECEEIEGKIQTDDLLISSGVLDESIFFISDGSDTQILSLYFTYTTGYNNLILYLYFFYTLFIWQTPNARIKFQELRMGFDIKTIAHLEHWQIHYNKNHTNH